MPAWNAERNIAAAIESVLAQSFRDFELLVIDDGSEDETAGIVTSYGDSRIRLLVNEKNLGLPETRNLGVLEACGDYVALCDSDDVAHPRRLEKQVAFLDGHRRHAVLGTWARSLDMRTGKLGVLLRPVHSDEIRARLLLTACFKNTTVMLRRHVALRFPYRDEFPLAEDIDCLTRISLAYPVANLPEILTCYRRHDGGITVRRRDLLLQMKRRVVAYQLEGLGLEFGEDDLRRHLLLKNPRGPEVDAAFVDWAEDWLLRLREANLRRPLYPEPHFGRALGERWLRVLWAARSRTERAERRFARSPLVAGACASAARAALSGLRWLPGFALGLRWRGPTGRRGQPQSQPRPGVYRSWRKRSKRLGSR